MRCRSHRVHTNIHIHRQHTQIHFKSIFLTFFIPFHDVVAVVDCCALLVHSSHSHTHTLALVLSLFVFCFALSAHSLALVLSLSTMCALRQKNTIIMLYASVCVRVSVSVCACESICWSGLQLRAGEQRLGVFVKWNHFSFYCNDHDHVVGSAVAALSLRVLVVLLFLALAHINLNVNDFCLQSRMRPATTTLCYKCWKCSYLMLLLLLYYCCWCCCFAGVASHLTFYHGHKAATIFPVTVIVVVIHMQLLSKYK